VFMLGTHAGLVGNSRVESESRPDWSTRRAIVVLVLATVGVAFMSELLVGATEEAGRGLGLSHMFVGTIIVPIIGNAAEHATAVLMTLKNKTDLAVSIAVGSSTQVALFVAPVLVLIALVLGRRMDFVFTPLEVVAVGAAVAITNIIVRDGESNWFEGVQLLAVYAILAAAFYWY